MSDSTSSLIPRSRSLTKLRRGRFSVPCLFAFVALSSASLGWMWGWTAPQTLPPPLAGLDRDRSGDNARAADVALSSDTPHRQHLARPVTIAVLGIDARPDLANDSPQRFEANSDTIALVHFAPEARSVRLVSVPRDTRVEIPGYGLDKLNRANARGGAALVVDSLEQLLDGVTVDRVVRVDLAAARQAIDRVGGLELYVTEPMQYVDRAQGLTIDLEPGWQLLDGAQSLQFARYRSDGLGDVGRVQRQQQVFNALLSRLRRPSIAPELPGLLAIVRDAVDTDMTTRELLALVKSAIDATDFQAVLLPGDFAEAEAGDASGDWIPDAAAIERIASQFLAATTEADFINAPGARTQVANITDLRLALQNNSGAPIAFNRLEERLNAHNNLAAIVRLPPGTSARHRTEVIAQSGDLEAARVIRNALGCGTLVPRSTGALDSDVTVAIGRDCLMQWGETAITMPKPSTPEG